jgi:hypothetical protein
MALVLLNNSKKRPKIILIDPEMDPLPENENLLVYKTEGGLEQDQVNVKSACLNKTKSRLSCLF